MSKPILTKFCPKCGRIAKASAIKFTQLLVCPGCQSTVKFQDDPNFFKREGFFELALVNLVNLFMNLARFTYRGLDNVISSVDYHLKTKTNKEEIKKVIMCPLCGAEMAPIVITYSLMGILFFILGALFCFTVIGVLVGIPLICVGIYLMSVIKGKLRCKYCNYEVDRHAKSSFGFWVFILVCTISALIIDYKFN